MTVVAQRTGLKTRLATINGLRVPDGYDLASVPAAVVGEFSIPDYRKTMRGTTGPLREYEWTIRLYVAKASDRAAMAKLDGYLDGENDVVTAIEADTTLGGAAETLAVTGMSGYGVYEVAGQQYLGAELSVTVWARGT